MNYGIRYTNCDDTEYMEWIPDSMSLNDFMKLDKNVNEYGKNCHQFISKDYAKK